MFSALFLCSALSFAGDIPDIPEEEEALDLEDKIQTTAESGFDLGQGAFEIEDDEEDEDDMVDFVAKKLKEPPPPTHFHLDPAGHQPLHNDWPIQLVSFNEAVVVLQLPVLVGQTRAGFEAAYPHGLLLRAQWTAGEQHSTVEQHLHAADLWTTGPTWAFLQIALPTTARAAEVRAVVQTAPLPAPPDPEAKRSEPAAQAEPVDAYAVTTVFMRQ